MDSRNFAIGILSTTAVILFVGLVIINTRPEPALAAGMTTTLGEYVLTVGTLTNNDQELVYVLNTPEQKILAYRFDSGRKQIEVVDGIDLSEMRKASSTTPVPPAAGKKPPKPAKPTGP